MTTGRISSWARWGRFPGSGAAAPAPSLPAYLTGATIRADGWSLDAASTPPSTILEDDFTVNRAGFDSTATAVTHSNVPIYSTKRVRQPGVVTLDALRCGVSDMVFAADSVPGMTNNSTAISPKPVVNWADFDRDLIGNSLTLEVSAMHLLGAIARVRFTVTDGTNTVTADVTAATAVKTSTDVAYLVLYTATIDTSTLSNGLITANVQVHPKYGVAASVFDSATEGLQWWQCAPQYFIKDTGRLAALPRCYIDPVGGNNTTGVWSDVDATALASPFLTMAGALASAKIAAIPAGSFLAAGTVDGCEMRFLAGAHALAFPATNTTQRAAALILCNAPGVAKADITLSLGATARARMNASILSPTPSAALRFRNLQITRSVGLLFQAEAALGLAVQLENADLNDGGFNNAYVDVSGSRTTLMFVNGSNFTTPTGSSSYGTGFGLARGITCAMNAFNFAGWNVLGCALSNLGSLVDMSSVLAGTTEVRNATWQGNLWMAKAGLPNTFAQGGTRNVNGFARYNNIHEYIGTANQTALALSADAQTGSVYNCMIFHETWIGFDFNGRWNYLYVDNDSPTASRDRTHTYTACKANIPVSVNMKQDLFTPPNALRIGGWPAYWGCGTDFNFVQFIDADDGDNAPEYWGRGTTVGTSDTVRLDALFVDYEGPTGLGVGGAGNGDYRLQSGSPCKAAVVTPDVIVPFDLDGVARSTTTSIGAFV